MIVNSKFWHPLWKHYRQAPSIALCRVPELEYASTLDTTGAVLDHCCGDGLFASMAWSNSNITVGCDLSKAAIERARYTGIYKRLDVCDASKKLPYDTGTFDVIFNNSALEHIFDLDAALQEVSRVLKPGGEFAFSVLNHRYFEWWPLDVASQKAYKDWQPFYHALNISEWSYHLEKSGLKITRFEGYFDQNASKQLAKLDYWFSGASIKNLQFTYVKLYRILGIIFSNILKKQLETLEWETAPDKGAGFFIQAIK